MELDEICRRPVRELLPHREPMILIDEACGMEGQDFKARVRISPRSQFFDGHGVPAWVGIEYMAQTVAAYAGAEGLAQGGQIHVGMLLGTRDYVAEVPVFENGQDLEVLVRKDLFQVNGVSSLHCRILEAGRLLAQAQVTVIDVPDITAIHRLAKQKEA
jgi:predicted hotdog family 3-hydroxylacyl-ACP dehydratase